MILLIISILLSEICFGQIYSSEKVFEYKIYYYQSRENITTGETIHLTITGKKWKKSEDQSEAIWDYQAKPETQKKFQNQFSIGWLTADTTGIIENEDKIWIHPPRHNQYTLTEIAPFPDFRKNLKIGDTYNTILQTGSGWGDWTGKKIKSTYVINNVSKENGDIFWKINATSEIEGNTNSLEFILSEKKGFVSLVYNFFNGDKMTMELKEK